MKHLNLRVLDGVYAVWQLASVEQIPDFETSGLLSITRTDGELSIVGREELAPKGVSIEKGWKCFEVAGPLDFEMTGILASIASPLAAADVPIFVISTFDTDYVLVKQEKLETAKGVLRSAGHKLSSG